MGDIILTREDQELYRVSEYKVFIDGKEVNTISNNSRKVIRLQAGSHEVFVKVMGAKSPVKQINIKEKETLRLSCGSKLSGLKYVFHWLYSFSKHNIYLEETV